MSSPRSSQRGPLKRAGTSQSRAPAPTPLRTQADVFKGRLAQPSRPVLPSRRTPPTSSVLTSEVYVSTRGPFPLAGRLLARKPPTRHPLLSCLTHGLPWPLLLLLIHGVFFFFGCAVQHVGSWFPDQGWNPSFLQWKQRVLTTGPPAESRDSV